MEEQIASMCLSAEKRLRRRAFATSGVSDDPSVEERVTARIRASSASTAESLDELRSALDLPVGEADPLRASESLLAVLEQQRVGHRSSAAAVAPTLNREQRAMGAGVVLVPLVAALLAGALAVQQEQPNTTYGRTLTGDRPLAGLQIVGDLSALPPSPQRRTYEMPTHEESLTLEFIRDSMDTTLRFSHTAALLPDDLELTVALLPLEDYLDYAPHPDWDDYLQMDYGDLILAYQEVKQTVAQEYPQVLDERTGDVALGQGILPIWMLPDGELAMGYALTGEISTGVDSRLGAYYFNATEPRVLATDDFLLGDDISWELTQLGRALEYNHQETAKVGSQEVFWLTALTVWTGVQTFLLIGAAVLDTVRRRRGTRQARELLSELRGRLEQLALGLDLSRLDMVAVLGSRSISDGPASAGTATEGRAEQADQRLYETALVTAWRELDDLELTPRPQQRGEQWTQRVQHAAQLIDTLSVRDVSVRDRAAQLLRTHQIL
ncbi:hypothetical protein GCM10009771_01920 [Nesterenkonia flava]